MRTEQINGRTYKVRRRTGGRYVYVRGPLECKRPHRAMYDTEREQWVVQDGLAGYERGGMRVRRFYAEAIEAVELLREQEVEG